MGNAVGLYLNRVPNPNIEPAFEPLAGFTSGRKERVMLASKDELISSKIPLSDRDYCAHHLLNYRACRADVFPFVYKCEHAKHVYLTCEYEDYILRMKEYEREKRMST